MLAGLERFFSPPTFDDAEKTRIAAILNTILLAMIAILGAFLVFRLVSGTDTLASFTTIAVGAMVLLALVLVFVVRRGYVRAASYVYVFFVWGSLTAIAFKNDGARGSAFISYAAIMVLASLLLGWKASIAFALMSIAAMWGLAHAEAIGLIAVEIDPPYKVALETSTIFALAAVFLALGTSGLRRAVERARRDEQILAESHRELESEIAERKRVEAALEERLRFEVLLSELSATFVNVPTSGIDGEVERWLGRVAEFLAVDRARLYELDKGMAYAECTYGYRARGGDLPPSRLTAEEFPYAFDRLRRGESFVFSGVDTLPQEAAAERAFFRAERVQAHLTVPLRVGGTVLGALSFSAMRAQLEWPDELVKRLHLIGEILANALVRMRAEEQLRRLNENLEQHIRERTAQLESANEELEAFAYSVSHDLRAPLRAVDGFSRILLTEHASELGPDTQRYLHIVRASAQQMDRLIDSLLTLSRLGRQTLNKQTVSPEAVVRQALRDLHAEATDREVEVTIADLPPCQADPLLLGQVYVNLLSNALKFTRTRDVAHIEVGSERLDGEQVYYVRDNGVGFDMRYAHKLFGVFQRLHDAESYEGTGVGLAIVQRIIHRHGGRAWAKAQLGQGATFYFTLE